MSKEEKQGSEEECSSDESAEEFVHNPFSKNKQITIANSSDLYIWVGIQGERQTSRGGQEYRFDAGLEGVSLGVGVKRSVKDNQLISRIPWQRVQFHSIDRIRYQTDTIKEGTLRVIVWCSNVERPMEKIVLAGDCIIVAQDGSIKIATNERIKPVGFDKQPLSKRDNKALYKKERRRQRKWIPEDVAGEIQDIILDPHIQRGISPKECKYCSVNLQRDPKISIDNARLQNLEEEQRKLMDAGVASTSALASFGANADASIE